ncbi:hypothetical protein HYFRA_00001763 [Hymenoscyphus fraxineus]|uniref:Heterokaryon incompatibility domain-containing protein n=1 Tax=Hymenoscyphus fraxineus TaxID=746836 RepID=A0A9N9KJD6_9HELO|nr:hypothetical protein HYFRA_00001763 [Hymenoscyphus fraxineus]
MKLFNKEANGLIRVLRVLSTPGEDINCNLEVIDLKSPNVPQYSCLSYTWENPLYEDLLSQKAKWNNRNSYNTPPININKELLKIGPNLHEALLQMIGHGVLSERNLIWIDAGYENLCLEPLNDQQRLALVLGTFFWRRYFGLVWILQEIFAASMAARTLRETRIGMILDEEMDIAASGSKDNMKSSIVSNQSYFEALRVSNQDEEPLSLETLLTYSQSCGATDPRDYVFAVLGIWKHFLENDSELAGFLYPDYVAGVKTAYTKATIACMIESGNMNVLSSIEDSSFYVESRKEKDLPSWVQDLTMPRKSHSLKAVLGSSHDKQYWSVSAGMEWDDSPLRNILGSEHDNIFVLPVEGIKISTIEEISTSDDELDTYRDFCTFLSILQNHINSISPSNIPSSIEAFCKTLLANPFRAPSDTQKTQTAFPLLITMWVWELEIDLEKYDNPEDLLELYEYSKLLISDLSRRDPTGTIPTWTSIQDLIRVSKEEYDKQFSNGLAEAHDEILESFKRVFLGRRMFRTEDNYLGIGPRSLEAGDEV